MKGIMKTFKVTVVGVGILKGEGNFKHEHIVKATSKKALENRLIDMEIINGREHVRIEELKATNENLLL